MAQPDPLREALKELIEVLNRQAQREVLESRRRVEQAIRRSREAREALFGADR